MTGSPFVTKRSIKRVPRRIVAFTIVERAPASAFSIGVKVIPSTALGCIRAPFDGTGVTFSFDAWPRAVPSSALPSSSARPSARITRASICRFVRFCSIVRSAS